jgi:hypothetical protein
VQPAILDGPEYQTLRAWMRRTDNPKNRTSKEDDETAATWTLVVGDTTLDQQRVVGVLVDPSSSSSSSSSSVVYCDSLAKVSASISPSVAIATMLQAISHVQTCLLPTTHRNDDNSETTTTSPWHVVIVGGGDAAVTASEALQCVGCQTTLVTTATSAKSSASSHGTTILAPAVGDLQQGFAEVVGRFDVLLDTLGDEYGRDGDSSVVRLLQERHGCHTYVSTKTKSQQIISDAGLLWGPAQVKDYHKRLRARKLPQLVPPVGLGATVERLFQSGITFPLPDGFQATTNNNNNNMQQPAYIRGWNLPQYWEATTWPRDSAGGANVRFGFPVVDDLLESMEERFMINEPPAREAAVLVEDTQDDDNQETEANPFLLSIVGVHGLQTQIIDPELDCLLFLSAPFCRTCRYLSPQYSRMARIGHEKGKGPKFGKANATGKAGKELGRAFGVDSVPTFLFFRKGRLFGKPLSISRLPSKKLMLAMEMLNNGEEWDDAKLREADEKPKDGQ